jgi:hypothetical protein
LGKGLRGLAGTSRATGTPTFRDDDLAALAHGLQQAGEILTSLADPCGAQATIVSHVAHWRPPEVS